LARDEALFFGILGCILLSYFLYLQIWATVEPLGVVHLLILVAESYFGTFLLLLGFVKLLLLSFAQVWAIIPVLV